MRITLKIKSGELETTLTGEINPPEDVSAQAVVGFVWNIEQYLNAVGDIRCHADLDMTTSKEKKR